MSRELADDLFERKADSPAKPAETARHCFKNVLRLFIRVNNPLMFKISESDATGFICYKIAFNVRHQMVISSPWTNKHHVLLMNFVTSRDHVYSLRSTVMPFI